MVFVSTFIDRGVRLGRGEVGSSNLATGAIYRQKLAASSVGTTAQGTLTATRIIGTLSTIDVGSALLSYGSAGSTVGAFARFRYGSNYGTFRGENVRGRVGSFTRFGGSLNAAKIIHGSLGVGRIPPTGSLRGTLNITSRALGTLSDTRLPRQISSNKGTISSVMGSFSRFGGSIRAGLITHGSLGVGRIAPIGSLRGTIRIDLRTSGTLAVQRLVRQITNRGTINANNVVISGGTAIPGVFQPSGGELMGQGPGASWVIFDRNMVSYSPAPGSYFQGVASGGTFSLFSGSSETWRWGRRGVLRRGTIDADRVSIGSLTNQRLPINITAKGTVQSRYGSAGTATLQLLRGRYGSYTGTVRSPYIRGNTGSFSRIRIVGTINTNVGSHGTGAGGIARWRLGSLTGSIIAPLHRGRLGSYSGSIVVPLYRGRFGSYFGTLRAPLVRGVYGSFNHLAGTFSASHITHGTLGLNRLMKTVGSNLGGSLAGVSKRLGYWIFPAPFPDGEYIPMFALSNAEDGHDQNWTIRERSKSAGSLQWLLENQESAGNARAPGSLYMYAIR